MELFAIQQVNFMDLIHYQDFSIEQGKTTFICGKSGCGKSTLLKLMNGVVSAKSGTILYCGKDILEYDSIQLRREVLLCSQSIYLFEGSIRENFKEFYGYRNLPCPTEEEMRKYLSVCAADFSLDSVCATMSGGERQRIYIAIFLSFLPNVLLLDEPTSALDDDTSNCFFRSVIDFCKNKDISLIVISHNKRLAEKYADNIIVLGVNEWME